MKLNEIENCLSGLNIRANCGRIVVYCVSAGAYDNIKRIPQETGFDYFVLSDTQNSAPPPWTTVQLPPLLLSDVKKARMAKILAHSLFPCYDQSIYLDASVQVRRSLRELLLPLGTRELALVRHPERCCAFEEITAALLQNKGEPELLRQQAQAYAEAGLPAANGVAATGFMVRRHNDARVVDLMRTWADNLLNFSSRDQVSLAFALWKSTCEPHWFNFNIFRNEYFDVKPHSRVPFWLKARHEARTALWRLQYHLERVARVRQTRRGS